jgi:predicted CoA-binding protein
MVSDDPSEIESFLESGPYAVVGASRDRSKYGNKVLRCYLQHDVEVYPVNPGSTEIEGVRCATSLRDLPEKVRAVSVITPPEVTERIVEDLPAAGAAFVWMQPGAESDAAVARAEQLGLTVIHGGPCLLVALGFRDV